MPQPSPLPTELWLYIFRLAATSIHTSSLFTTTYKPFQSLTTGSIDSSLTVKYAIIRVCKSWRNLAMDLYCEDIVVSNESVGALRRILAGRDDGIDRNGRVRRLCLPFSSTVPQTSYPSDAVALLRMCTSLEVLVRPHRLYSAPTSPLFDREAEPCPPLPSLKRLDWWCHNDATRTGGINRLTDVIQAAPNLTYLFLQGEVVMSLAPSHATIILPSLTALHIGRVNMVFAYQVTRWTFPSLRSIIVDGFMHFHVLEVFAETFGPRIRDVEFKKKLKFFLNDGVHVFLKDCPNLEQLNYHVFFTQIPSPLSEPHTSLATIGLHGSMNMFIDGGAAKLWEHLEDHVEALCASCPSLQRIILYGDWSHLCIDGRPSPSERLRQKLQDAGRRVDVCVDGDTTGVVPQ